MKNILINNELKQIPDNVNTVAELLSFLEIPETGTATAINNKIVIARNRPSAKLNPNDSVTIITAAYGG